MSIPLNHINQTNNIFVNRIRQTQRQRLTHQVHVIQSQIRQILTFHPNEWLDAFRWNSNYPLFVKGDLDGFVALFINNLATLLAVILSLQPILGNDIVYGKIVPG
jgi:hypothetical protein